jgi:hypothetical protein
MKKNILLIATAVALLGPAALQAAADANSEIREQIKALQLQAEELEIRLAASDAEAEAARAAAEDMVFMQEDVDDLDKRMMKAERHATLDAIEWGGDFRFEAHSIQADVPSHFDGMALQKGMVDTMFYFTHTGGPPMAPGAVEQEIAQNYGQYLGFLDGLTYESLGQFLGMFTPEQQEQLMGSLLPGTLVPAYDNDNSILYTSRLRLEMNAAVSKDITFAGRLGMYKVWGDSTGVQVFDGSPTTIGWDGSTVGVPNSDILRVERAYFTLSNLGGTPTYLSIGRRPSTGGVPLNFRNDEPRGGTPLGTLIDYQFDGITFGWHINEDSTARLCYGVGFESGWGNGEILDPSSKLKDAQFLGVNWDIFDTPDMFVQATVARAFDVTDGFNGLVVLPTDPLTGNDVGAPIIMRYSPTETIGDIDLASVVLTRHDGPLDWFVTGSYMRSNPTSATTPFGGMFADPFQQPEKQSGTMYYLGGRYTFPNQATKLGLEYNAGSEYWFNFALAEDDIIAPKTSTRGNVIEAYLTHRISDHFVIKLGYLRYQFDYSGSGWLLGAPKNLQAGIPLLGFPALESANQLKLSMTARF